MEEKQKFKISPVSILKRIFDIPINLISSGGGIGFYTTKGRLNVANENVFKRDPHKIILFFYLLGKNKLLAHPNAIRMVRKSLKYIDHKLRNNR